MSAGYVSEESLRRVLEKVVFQDKLSVTYDNGNGLVVEVTGPALAAQNSVAIDLFTGEPLVLMRDGELTIKNVTRLYRLSEDGDLYDGVEYIPSNSNTKEGSIS